MEPVSNLISTLLNTRTQSHIYHLQTQSYGAHKALQGYYESIVELIDSYAEAYQGSYDIIRGYKVAPNIREDDNPIAYFEAVKVFMERIAPQLPDNGDLQNIQDEMLALVNTTLYKLKNLK
jgi:hypothetical protein